MLDLLTHGTSRTPRRAGRVELLVVGCGNPSAGDDAAGVEAVARWRETGIAGCRFEIVRDAGPELLDLFSAVEAALFVDAVTSSGLPGTLHLVPLHSGEIEPRLLGTLSSHGWGLAATLELGRALSRPLPRLLLLGIELGTVRPGAAPTAEVALAIARVVKEFPGLYARLADPQNSIWREPRHYLPDDPSFPNA